jgi:RsmE family RNA methyltransferase
MRDHHNFLFFASRIEGTTIEFDAEEARHAVAVLRHTPGDSIRATDGAGTLYKCRVASIGDGRLSAAILSRTMVKRHTCSLQLFVGLPKRDAFETLACNLAALGVERITPLVAGHCQQPWWKQWDGKAAGRLRGKMIAGMKQSSYFFLPQLDPPLAFRDIGSALSGFTIMADAEGSSFSTVLDTVKANDGRYSCIVGPPGGFAAEETAALCALGVLPVRIAASRLTTELAAVVMASEIMGVRLP